MKKSLAVVAVTAVAALIGCADDPTRPSSTAPIEPLEPSLSSVSPTDEVASAILVVADAALRVAPALADTPVRPRIVREFGEVGVALAFRDWPRARRALDGAQSLLERYGADASTAEQADLSALQLTIDHTRTILPQ